MGECYRITAEDCFLMKIHLPSLDELEDVVDRFTPYGLTTTRGTRAFEVGTNPSR